MMTMQTIHELGARASAAILDMERLLGDAPGLSADDHISLHLSVERDVKAIRASLRKVITADSKALTDRWGPPSAPPDPNQARLDDLLWGDGARRPDDIGEDEDTEGRVYGGTIVEAPPQSRDDENLAGGGAEEPAEAPRGRGRPRRVRE